jgi:hypothetical protein
MPRTVCYRVSERETDPALAPASAAGFLGAAVLTGLAAVVYLAPVGTIPQMLALALALCLAFVGVSFLRILGHTVLFALADEENGLLFRMGGGRRIRLPWDAVLKLVRARPTADSDRATLHLLHKPRKRLVLHAGEGQDELYKLAVAVLDRKRKGGTSQPAAKANESGTVASGHSPWGAFAWAMLKFLAVIAGALFLVLARDRAVPLEKAFFLAIAFEIAVPISLLPPSAMGSVLRAAVGPKGLTFQSLVYGTRTIRWEDLAYARVTFLGGSTVRMLEVFDRQGGRLVLPLARSREFLGRLDRHLGSRTEATVEAIEAALKQRAARGRKRRR